MQLEENRTEINDAFNDSIRNGNENENSTTSNEADVNFGQHNLTAIILLSLIYGLLSLTACVGNLLVIWIIGKCFLYFCNYLSEQFLPVCNLFAVSLSDKRRKVLVYSVRQRI